MSTWNDGQFAVVEVKKGGPVWVWCTYIPSLDRRIPPTSAPLDRAATSS